MSWLACKVGCHCGIKLGRGYCSEASLSFTGIANQSSMGLLDHTQNVIRDSQGLVANVQLSQGSVYQEIQSIEKAFRVLASSEAQQRLMVGMYISLCETCRKVKDLQYARRILLYVQDAGLENQGGIGYNLVSMLVECGSVRDAHQLFNRLAHQTEQCWTSLIRGYNACGQPRTALDLFQKREQDPGHASKHGIIAALRACALLRDLEGGRLAHIKIVEEMLEMDQLVSNALVGMYSKCNSLVDAQLVFNRLPKKDLVAWNTLIGGHTEHGSIVSLQEGLKQMRLDGVSPDNVTYLCILKSYDKHEFSDRIREVHAEIVKSGSDGIPNVGNYLVHMYAKHGSIAEAWQVLITQSTSNEIIWTALIGGYVEYGNMEEALSHLELMERYGVCPSDATFACILRACGSVEDGISRGKKLHAEVVKRALEVQVSVGNSLVNMYCKCGSLLDAQEVFDSLSTPDVFAWTALLSGYVEHGLSKEALNGMHQMQAEGVAPNATTYLCGLRACQSVEDVCKGQELHTEIVKEEYEGGLSLGTTLVDFYAKCGLLKEAKDVFDELPIRNVFSWSALISGFADQGDAEMTLHCLKEMELEGIAPTATTFLCGLKACGDMYTVFLAQEIHCSVVKKGLDYDTSITNSLLDVYLKCGLLLDAQKLFDGLRERDIISWNTLMGGYGDARLCSEALECMERMLKEGAVPDVPSFLAILKSCKFLGYMDTGHEAHAMVIKAGFEKEPFVAGALVDLYATHGKLADAESVFDQQKIRSVATWTALIIRYIEHGFGEKALERYVRMQQEGVRPDDSLYVCALKACGKVGAIDKGRELYGEVTKMGILEESMFYSSTVCTGAAFLKQMMPRMSRMDATALSLHNVLIDMFCRCGSLAEAQKVFDRVPTHDNATWNTLIAGHASLGSPECSIGLFHTMKCQGVQPDAVTYAIVLTACNHVGSIESGHMYIEEMSKVFGLLPLRQHYNCVLDLASRVGQLDVALVLVEKMPFQPDVTTWIALLGGCRKSGNTELGRRAFESLVSLSENSPSGFVLMSSIYVNEKMWEAVREIEVTRAMLRAEVG